MRIAVLGAGIVGVTTAYELSRNPNHEIIVVDAAASPASEASATNAAMIAPGHAYAWASPKVPKILLKSIYRNDQAFRIRFRMDWDFWRWTAKFLKHCNNTDAVRNSLRKHTLCMYSQARLHKIVAESGVDYEQVNKGLLFVYRNTVSLNAGIEHSELLSGNGQQMKVLNRTEVEQIEPALFQNTQNNIAGAIYCPTDETGNSHKFTLELVKICESRGVKFQFETHVKQLIANGTTIREIVSAKGNMDADLFIVALGAQTPLLLKPSGIDLPIYPVKGYSLSLPVEENHAPLTIGTVDEDNLIALAPMGNLLRATATAEFAGYDSNHQPKDFQPMVKVIEDLLPNAANFSKPVYKTCFRPMTPQGTPYIGFCKYKNLFINSGQGHMGWTMACGSARIAADLIEGKEPEIDSAPFNPMQ